MRAQLLGQYQHSAAPARSRHCIEAAHEPCKICSLLPVHGTARAKCLPAVSIRHLRRTPIRARKLCTASSQEKEHFGLYTVKQKVEHLLWSVTGGQKQVSADQVNLLAAVFAAFAAVKPPETIETCALTGRRCHIWSHDISSRAQSHLLSPGSPVCSKFCFKGLRQNKPSQAIFWFKEM